MWCPVTIGRDEWREQLPAVMWPPPRWDVHNVVMTETVPGAQLVDRVALVLRIVSAAMPQGLSTTRVAQAAGLARPTAHRILASLAANGFAARAVKVAKDAGLVLELTDCEGWSMGAPGGATFTAAKLDLIRVMSGRRSKRQVMAMDWLGDPSPYLPLLSPFGPLGDTDVNE